MEQSTLRCFDIRWLHTKKPLELKELTHGFRDRDRTVLRNILDAKNYKSSRKSECDYKSNEMRKYKTLGVINAAQ